MKHPLSYICFLHQTTTHRSQHVRIERCLISVFYIKPQHEYRAEPSRFVVLYLFSTSNHNIKSLNISETIVVLYLFSTSNHNWQSARRTSRHVVLYLFSTSNHNFCMYIYYLCVVVLYLFSTSNHNVKSCNLLLNLVVLYLFSTSNHNREWIFSKHNRLSYICFLHQTTTVQIAGCNPAMLSYICFLHQTTTVPCIII